MFSKLYGVVPKLLQRERVHQAWIFPETWRLVDKIIATRRDQAKISMCSLGLRIKVILQGDS